MKPNDIYTWQIQTADGAVYDQYLPDGTEASWKQIEPRDAIVRVSFIPRIPALPRHDVFIDTEKGERFCRRFGRGFLKQGPDGIRLREYLNCVVTNRYRFWVFGTSGRAMVTHLDQEVRL